MGQKPSQWSKYLKVIEEKIKEKRYNGSPYKIAEEINYENQLNLSPKKLDLLRTYVKRQQQRLRKEGGLTKNRIYVGTENIDQHTTQEEKSWEEDERKGSAIYEYKGERSIKTLEDALEFSEVDLSTWEVERHIFNSWDVTMKLGDDTPVKRTNYQVKVWFRRKEKLEIERPKFRHIEVIPGKNAQMWVAIGCVHRPFHDEIFWDRFITFLKHNRKDITGIIIDGDFLDLRSLSSHEEWIPDGVDLSMEYSSGLQGIDEIEQALGKGVDKIFIYGNHEDRFFRDKKSMRKYGSSLPSPHEAMELEERGWQVITDWRNGYVTLGKQLDVFHGVKIGMNAAKDQLNAIPNRNHIFFHTHRFGSHSNKTNTAYNLGCMIDFDHEAFQYTDRGVREAWAHGFGVIYIDEEGNDYVYPIKVKDNRHFFFKGIVY
jgi:hypothetical protein